MTIASPKQAYSQVMLKNEANKSQDRNPRYPSTNISGPHQKTNSQSAFWGAIQERSRPHRKVCLWPNWIRHFLIRITGYRLSKALSWDATMRTTIQRVSERFLTEIYRLVQVASPEVSCNSTPDLQEAPQSTRLICRQNGAQSGKSRIKQMWAHLLQSHHLTSRWSTRPCL